MVDIVNLIHVLKTSDTADTHSINQHQCSVTSRSNRLSIGITKIPTTVRLQLLADHDPNRVDTILEPVDGNRCCKRTPSITKNHSEFQKVLHFQSLCTTCQSPS
jgi:hypothetical protein